MKWAGGKGQLLVRFERYFPPEYSRYFELFLGGGAVFFHLKPEHATLSDTNAELIHLYSMVRDDPAGLMAALDVHAGRRNQKTYFYEVRKQRSEALSPAARAARTVFLNKTCFNGLYRVNSRGEFNVPFGYYRNPTLYSVDAIRRASRALGGAALLAEDFRTAGTRPRGRDFVYLDPPYQPISRTSAFTDYTREGFGEKDQRDLANLFHDLDRRGCFVMLSNSATPMLKELYAEYSQKLLPARRAINSKGSGRGAVDELLVTNY
ncbi:MAG: DNA adenine methylase [Thermoplasmata archaeon]|nr:DNA adenine methylase [Thermoplasmata archaeon]